MRPVALQKISPEEWQRDFAANAHQAVFKENLGEEDEIDIAIIGLIDGQVAGYSTAKFIGDGVIHLNYGGAVDDAKGTPELLMLYRLLIREYLSLGDYLRTYVHNKNRNYLLLALRTGFIVTGMRTFRGDTLLELSFDGEKN